MKSSLLFKLPFFNPSPKKQIAPYALSRSDCKEISVQAGVTVRSLQISDNNLLATLGVQPVTLHRPDQSLALDIYRKKFKQLKTWAISVTGLIQCLQHRFLQQLSTQILHAITVKIDQGVMNVQYAASGSVDPARFKLIYLLTLARNLSNVISKYLIKISLLHMY